jgi:hypothetical protein
VITVTIILQVWYAPLSVASLTLSYGCCAKAMLDETGRKIIQLKCNKSTVFWDTTLCSPLKVNFQWTTRQKIVLLITTTFRTSNPMKYNTLSFLIPFV